MTITKKLLLCALRSCYGFNETTGAYGFSVATDEDLFQQGDIYLFTWRDETLPCVGFSVDEIGQDAGGWYAVVTVG